MSGSPLLIDERYKMARVDLDSVVRNRIGLHKNENVNYRLERDDILEELVRFYVQYRLNG